MSLVFMVNASRIKQREISLPKPKRIGAVKALSKMVKPHYFTPRGYSHFVCWCMVDVQTGMQTV